MSEAISALQGAAFEGYVRVSEAGLRGMISLRGDLSAAKVKAAVKKVTGLAIPDQRQITFSGEKGLGWMSPDELLVLVPYDDAGATVEALQVALAGVHHLTRDVSDARAIFRVEGDRAREVLAKLSPTDLHPDRFREGELRRTRLAQVPAAFWIEDGGITVVAFRSVAQYVFDLLKTSAEPGGEVNLW